MDSSSDVIVILIIIIIVIIFYSASIQFRTAICAGFAAEYGRVQQISVNGRCVATVVRRPAASLLPCDVRAAYNLVRRQGGPTQSLVFVYGAILGVLLVVALGVAIGVVVGVLMLISVLTCMRRYLYYTYMYISMYIYIHVHYCLSSTI